MEGRLPPQPPRKEIATEFCALQHYVVSLQANDDRKIKTGTMTDSKIINDPVFGFIKVPRGLLLDIVRHPLLQRLARIKQLGLTQEVYPGAQHTRFQHSLGAFHLMS